MIQFSCIIPAYNAENTIEKCVHSIINQDFSDYEIIIVDDGSTDNTYSVLSQLQSRYNCIRIFHQKNARQGAARNRGIQEAQGQYIWFIDADDWIEGQALVHYSEIIKEKFPDIIFANYAFCNDKEQYRANPILGHIAGKFFTFKDITENILINICGWNAAPYRYIVRRTLLIDHDIKFIEKVFYEDHQFSLHLISHMRSIYIDASPNYIYYQHCNSTVNIQDSRIFDFILIRKLCLSYIKEWKGDKLYPKLVIEYLLPLPFYMRHVPSKFRKKFLQKLHEDIDHELVRQILPLITPRSAYKNFYHAICAENPYYIVLRKWKRSVCRYTLDPFKTALKKLRKTFKRALAHPHGNGSIEAHPSVDTSNISLEIRVTSENRPYIFVEKDTALSGHFVFERGIGYVRFGERCSVGGDSLFVCSQDQGIEVGSQTMISWGCTLMDTNFHSLDANMRHNDAWHWTLGVNQGSLGLYKDWTGVKSAPIRIGDHVWIGFGCTILAGVTIGRGAIVGAKSVVKKSVPPFTVFAGNPAQFVRLAPRSCGWRPEELLAGLQAAPSAQKFLYASCRHENIFKNIQQLEKMYNWDAIHAFLSRTQVHTVLVYEYGNGAFAILLACLGIKVTAYHASFLKDLTGSITEKLSQKIPDDVLANICFRENDKILNINEQYDLILSHGDWPFWRDPLLELNILAQHLKPQGSLFISGFTPNTYFPSLHTCQVVSSREYGPASIAHLLHQRSNVSEKDCRMVLRQAGFQDIQKANDFTRPSEVVACSEFLQAKARNIRQEAV